MPKLLVRHLEEEELELYLLGKLTGARIHFVEEHLLYCECCIRNAELIHRDIIVVRDILRQYERSATAAKISTASAG